MRNKIIVSLFLLIWVCTSLLFIFYSQRWEDIQEETKEIQSIIVPINNPNLETELEDIETDISKMPWILIDNGDGTYSIVANNAQEWVQSGTLMWDYDIEFYGQIIDNGDGTQSIIAQ